MGRWTPDPLTLVEQRLAALPSHPSACTADDRRVLIETQQELAEHAQALGRAMQRLDARTAVLSPAELGVRRAEFSRLCAQGERATLAAEKLDHYSVAALRAHDINTADPRGDDQQETDDDNDDTQ